MTNDESFGERAIDGLPAGAEASGVRRGELGGGAMFRHRTCAHHLPFIDGPSPARGASPSKCSGGRASHAVRRPAKTITAPRGSAPFDRHCAGELAPSDDGRLDER